MTNKFIAQSIVHALDVCGTFLRMSTDSHTESYYYLANTKRPHNIGLMLTHTLRRWPSIKLILFQCLLFLGYGLGPPSAVL